MHVGMSAPAQREQPRQNYGNRACSINAVDHQAEYVEQYRGFKLVGNVVRDLDHIIWPYSIVQCRLLTIYLTGMYGFGFSHPEHNKHNQGQ